MNIGSSRARLRNALCALLCVAGGTQLAQALEVTVSAQYRGQSSGQFENTTPLAEYCQRWPAQCSTVKAMSIPITFSKRTVWQAANIRDRLFVQLPAPRQVDVFHQQTGERHTLSLAFTAISQKVVGGAALNNNPAFSADVYGGCKYILTYGNPIVPPPAWYLWGAKDPQAPTGCHSSSRRHDGVYEVINTVSETGVAYNLIMPPPYRMKPGIYTGTASYTIGPGGDFDFGDGVTDLNGTSLMLNFVLDVQHAFLFDFPPGSDRAVLEPSGGWQSWLGGRGGPPKLERDLPFRLWSTGPFKVYKLCQQYLGNGCAISNANSHAVPVTVGLSLPGGILHQGRPVQRLELPSGPNEALAFESVTPTLNRPGQLHFTVGSQDIKAMLSYPGSRYEGLVTVVFDSEL